MAQTKVKSKARLPAKTKVKAKQPHSAARKACPMKAKAVTNTQKLNLKLEKAIRANIETKCRSEASSSDGPGSRPAASRKDATKVAMKNIIRKLK